jgi:hypothetical protein
VDPDKMSCWRASPGLHVDLKGIVELVRDEGALLVVWPVGRSLCKVLAGVRVHWTATHLLHRHFLKVT